jgi:excisionase family DNA binding protein
MTSYDNQQTPKSHTKQKVTEMTFQRLKMYTLNEISELLKIGKKTLMRFIESGDLQAYKIGKSWRISEKELEKFINSKAA